MSMPHFLFAVHVDDERTPMSMERQRQAWDDTGAFNDRMREIGALIYANGLAQEASIVAQDGSVRDGQYVSGPRHLGGFWILDFPDHETAMHYAVDAAAACNEPVEVRAFH